MLDSDNVLIFTPDGCICAATYNCPGSWHDSAVAVPIYETFNDSGFTPPPFRVIADSAFIASDRCVTCLTLPQRARASVQSLRMNANVVAARQAAEWGMHTLQSVFNRLTLPLPCDTRYNARLFLLAFHLFNFRAKTVGNQIQSVFDPEDNAYIDIEKLMEERESLLNAMFHLFD